MKKNLNLTKPFWWSPDSKFLAFLRFDETEVPEYLLTIYAGEKPRHERI